MKTITIGFSKSTRFFPILSWAIRLFEWSKYSHVYISFTSKTFDRVLIYQASGLQVNFMSNTRFLNHNKIVKEYLLNVEEGVYKEIIKSAIDNVGTPYGIAQILGIAITRISRIFGYKIKNPLSRGQSSYVCSELVGSVLNMLNADIIKEYDLDLIGPKQIDQILEKHINQSISS